MSLALSFTVLSSDFLPAGDCDTPPFEALFLVFSQGKDADFGGLDAFVSEVDRICFASPSLNASLQARPLVVLVKSKRDSG